ncbi:MAG: hypothetical protein CMP55_05195 [Flavobacteriales bacterium]|jgi:hypothetical protein|nr:hypothetical protein [Flavobacteriales bacterium]|tara:strand:- start:3476 stop:4810 length:1335 start_codon:yes stop_codon:yes gene_type:complete
MSTDTKDAIPENFKTLVKDFIDDLTNVFPEYDFYWSKWGNTDITNEELKELLNHCAKVYPERFFDILYQNEDIFAENSDINTYFLPRMDFRILFNSEGLSENSKKVLWKYLQLMLFTVVGSVDDKKSFGESANIFDGIDENVLQEKLEETMKNIGNVFEKMDTLKQKVNEMEGTTEDNQETNTGETPNPRAAFENLPNMENLQSHLKQLFDGKIGKLAKELAEEVADEFKDVVGGDDENPQNMIKNLMKNPNKIKNLMKTVSGRLDEKMKSGEISKDELMKEAGQFLNEIKKTSGDAGVNEMLQSAMKNMGGLGKNAKINKSALNRLMKQSESKEKMQQKANVRKQEILRQKEKERKETFDRIREQNRLKAQFKLQQKENPDSFVFTLDGEDVQEKSFVHPDLIAEMKKEEEEEKNQETTSKKKKKKKKKKTNATTEPASVSND